MRIGLQPPHVNQSLSHNNSVLIPEKTTAELQEICIERRAERHCQRKMKSNAAIATVGLISLSKSAQRIFNTLSITEQDTYFRSAAEAVSNNLKTTLSGLVVHRDESAIHSHFQIPAFALDGTPVSKKAHYSALQDIVGKVVESLGITRGIKKTIRIKNGEDKSAYIHHSVKQLHYDLPLEISALEEKITALNNELKKLNSEHDVFQEKAFTNKFILAKHQGELSAIKTSIAKNKHLEENANTLVLGLINSKNREVRRYIKKAITSHGDKNLTDHFGLGF